MSSFNSPFLIPGGVLHERPNPGTHPSGLIFPIENMPGLFQIGSFAIPVRYYAIILRGVFLKGSGLSVLWPGALTLLLTGLLWLSFASARFRKRLD